ncbi:MAG: orotate phosphoribosyltransferase [Lysobacterales bacterium CG02_land_8_20_14_3_00_62_12]|nr:MAG: orotate phosphoribosyltransferase [Xanthomonadales bacterium CG02_land_8_20_14_3_00_62_12]PJA39042.1 MAG: orotate phosphoribosyltransferase [Xanthomonadales bacterium CG_4_9_14_3_um_filter_62_6]
MQAHQRAFLQLALHYQVLSFGRFTLKSGRVSPYFFNAGLFNTGRALQQLGRAFATTLAQSNLTCDMLFGPAYKGIALATSTAIALAEGHGRDLPLAFNRKEAKDHGEAGLIIGAPLKGRVLIVDDVITAGTSVREAVALIEAQGAVAAGVLIALDRQEVGVGSLSAAEEVRQHYHLPVLAIAGLDELLTLVAEDPLLVQHRDTLIDYRKRYGVASSAAP